jgi:hypothetical protein
MRKGAHSGNVASTNVPDIKPEQKKHKHAKFCVAMQEAPTDECHAQRMQCQKQFAALVPDLLFRRLLGSYRRTLTCSMCWTFAERHRDICKARLVCREWALGGLSFLAVILKLRRRVFRLLRCQSRRHTGRY